MSLYQSRVYHASDNLPLHYLLWPNMHSQQCCVMLHGFTNDAHIFDTAAKKLQSQMNVYALDARGHGDSSWDEKEQYTHEQLQDDLLSFLKTLPFQQFHLVGHSLGARVALLLLGRSPDGLARCKSFTIIDTGPEVSAIGVKKVREDAENTPTAFDSTASFHRYLANIYLLAEENELQRLADFGLKELEIENGAKVLAPKTDPAFARALWKPDSKQGDSSDLKYPLNEELWQALDTVDCPTLIMKGQASAILSRKVAQRMLDSLQQAELQTISRAGHALMVDNPSEFSESLYQFILKHK